jgi:hypothetical protein
MLTITTDDGLTILDSINELKDLYRSEYNSWYSAKQRCYNSNNHSYKRYGGRGIKMCERWLHSFNHFLEDMGPRPSLLSLDRIDNDGNYSPLNCRWTSYITQARHQINNHHRKPKLHGPDLFK